MFQLSHLYMITGKTVALTIQTFVGKVMSLLFNTLSRFVIAFLPRSKGLLISGLQLQSVVTKKIKSVTLCVNRSVVSDYLWPHGLQPARLLCPWNFQGKNTGMGCHFLLQGIFPTQGSNLCFLHLLYCQADPLPLHYLESPILHYIKCKWIFFLTLKSGFLLLFPFFLYLSCYKGLGVV